MEYLAIVSLIITSLLLVSIFFLIKEIRIVNEEKNFWRYAAITMSDKAYELFKEVRETAIDEIKEENIDSDNMPFIFIGGKTIAEIKGEDYKGDFSFLDQSAYEQYDKEVNRVAKDSVRNGYDWLNEKDTGWVLNSAFKNS